MCFPVFYLLLVSVPTLPFVLTRLFFSVLPFETFFVFFLVEVTGYGSRIYFPENELLKY